MDKIEKYTILEKLHESDFADVYRVATEDVGNAVLKIARQPILYHNNLITREYHILSKLRHPGIVRVMAYGVTPDAKTFFVSEYIQGQPINEYFKGFSRDLMRSMTDLLTAIIHIHSAGYVHGDLKPGHIHYEPRSEKTVLLDFGFAAPVFQNEEARGTLGYAAPELLKGHPPDQYTDIYSLGVILSEIIGGTSSTVLQEHQKALIFRMQDPLYSPDSLFKNLAAPDDIKRVLIKMLAIEPALRPTAGEIYETFVRYSGTNPISVTTIKPSAPPMPFIDITQKFEFLKSIDNVKGKTHILTGDIGMGKTTLLNELIYAYRISDFDVIDYNPVHNESLISALGKYCAQSDADVQADGDFAMFEVLINLLKNKQINCRKPLILIVDDLEGLSSTDKKLIRYLGSSLGAVEIGLIGAALNIADFEGMDFSDIKMKVMTRQDTQTLLHMMFSGQIVDDAFIEWLLKSSGGVPLYLQTLIGLLIQNGVINFKDSKWTLDDEKYLHIPYPKRIKELLSSKINAHSAPAKLALELFCLSDHALEPALVIAVLGDSYETEIDKLTRDQLITRIQIAGRPAYAPANLLIKQLIERHLSDRKKTDFQRKLFPLLIKFYGDIPEYFGFIAEIAGAIESWKDGYGYARRAAEHEEKRYNFSVGDRYYRLALGYSLKAGIDDRYLLLVKSGQLNLRTGNTREALDRFQKAERLARDNIEKAEIYHLLGYTHQKIGDYKQSSDYFTEALSLTDLRDPQYPTILSGIIYNHIQLGNYSDAENKLKELDRLADETDSLKMKYRQAYLSGVLHWFKGEASQGVDVIKTALPIADKLNQPLDKALGYSLLASLYQQQGKYKETDDSYRDAIQIYEQIKEITLLAETIINQALFRENLGRYDEALRSLNAAYQHVRRIGNQNTLSRLLVNMANIYEIKGDYTKALSLNNQAFEQCPDNLKSLYNLCMIYLKKGNSKKAAANLKLFSRSGDSVLYHTFNAYASGRINKSAAVREHLDQGLLILKKEGIDPIIKTEFFLRAAESCYNVKLHGDCIKYTEEGLKLCPTESREYWIATGLRILASFCLNDLLNTDMFPVLSPLKARGCLFDWAMLKRMELEAVLDHPRASASALSNINDINSAEEIFLNAIDNFELSRLRKAREQLRVRVESGQNPKSGTENYLSVFNMIGDLLNERLGEDDFIERLLDIVLTATKAERGALFFAGDGDIKFAAGRNIDKKTIADVRKLSRSVIDEAQNKMELIDSNDVLHDERFRNSKSVILNRIRSLLCVPLKINRQAVGIIYLDNTYEKHVFGDDDKYFLKTVANLLAATIEKSLAFQRLKKENAALKNGAISEIAEEYLIGNSAAIQNIRETIEKVADTNTTILITGDTGCGKGIVARLIHQRSTRNVNRFVSINCGAFPETLFEAELFGSKKGAFTGAVSDRKGLFLEADKGTLFLDEISNTPILVQGKLLDAIEDKQIRRLGENLVHKVDVRLICATNQNLEDLIKLHQFRADLFYRISILNLFVPPLRNRPEDIPLLADHFLKKYAREINPGITGFDRKAIRTMVSYPWPGNVRELQNAIERAVIYTRSNNIGSDDLRLKTDTILPNKIKDGYRDRIISTLQSTKCNISMTAKLLGITRVTLYSYIKKYDIDIPTINKPR